MCSNLNSVLDSIGLASNVFLLLEWVSNSILSSHAHLPLSTYSTRDSIKKRGADVEQSRKISLQAALARQGCSCPSGLLLPVRAGTSWDCLLASPLTITFAGKTWCLLGRVLVPPSWGYRIIPQEVAQLHPLISHKGMASLTDKHFTQKRAYSGSWLSAKAAALPPQTFV